MQAIKGIRFCLIQIEGTGTIPPFEKQKNIKPTLQQVSCQVDDLPNYCYGLLCDECFVVINIIYGVVKVEDCVMMTIKF